MRTDNVLPPHRRENDFSRLFILSEFCQTLSLRYDVWLEEKLKNSEFYYKKPLSFYSQLIQQLFQQNLSDSELLQQLRITRNQIWFRIIFRDVLGLNSFQETSKALSFAADQFIASLVNWIEPKLLVIACGKLGGEELNLSSDIDLIFAYPDNSEHSEQHYIRAAQKLIHYLNNQTEEGFVFRVDMRLRPFGDTGPIVMSISALEEYYQNYGREWERYALIKARLITGFSSDRRQLQSSLLPFVFRRYVDYGVLDAVREMKALIEVEVTRRHMDSDIKLGRGGIRELEFMVQALQLIWGGKIPAVRARNFLLAVKRLAQFRLLKPSLVQLLRKSYIFLRNLENRLQAVNDQQTHTFNFDHPKIQAIAHSMGFNHPEEFYKKYKQIRAATDYQFRHRLQQGLLAEKLIVAELQPEFESLIQQLKSRPAYARLTELAQKKADMVIQHSIQMTIQANIINPGQTLSRLFEIIAALVQRSAYLSLLIENPASLKLLIRLSSKGAYFSEILSHYPWLVDELLVERIHNKILTYPQFLKEVNDLLHIHSDVERTLEALQELKWRHILHIAVMDVTHRLPLMKVSDGLTWLAEAILEGIVKLALQKTKEKLKRDVNPLRLLVVGYGKLGGLELSYASDLDIILLYEGEDNEFYFRLGQQIIHLLNLITPMGKLYEVDLRLRPSGSSGMLVSEFSSFVEYQVKQAWIWEHQALVRARPVAGFSPLKIKFSEQRIKILQSYVKRDTLKAAIVEMRQKIQTQATRNEHLKYERGGLIDIEFLVQYLVLLHAQTHPNVILYTDNVRQLEQLVQAGVITATEGSRIIYIYKFYRKLLHRLALQRENQYTVTRKITANFETIKYYWQK